MWNALCRTRSRGFMILLEALVLAGLVMLWPGTVAAADPVLDQQQLIAADMDMAVAKTVPMAQTFRPGVSGQLVKISLPLYNLCGTLCNNRQVLVRVMEGTPDASGAVLDSALVTVTSPENVVVWYDFVFPAKPVLTQDNVYTMIVSAPTAANTGLAYKWANVYDRGEVWVYAPNLRWEMWTGADDSDLAFKTWMIPNTPPTLALNAGLTVAEGQAAAIDPAHLRAVDAESPATALTFHVGTAPMNGQLQKSGLPLSAGATFTQDDVDNGRIAYVHNGSETTSDHFTFTVADELGSTTGTATFTIAISPVNDPPVFTSASTNSMQTVPEGGQLTALAATDAESDALVFSVLQGSLPEAVTLNPDGTFAGTLSYRSAGTYALQVAVSDGHDTTVGQLTIIVTNVDTTPTLAPISDQTNRKNDRVSLAVTASDPDGDAITFRAQGLPAGLTVDPATGTISGRIDNKAAGDYHVTVFAVDSTPVNGNEHSGSVSFTWTVAKRVTMGAVTDAATGRPVSGALLVIRTASGAVVSRIVTGADGTFSAELPDGTYTVSLTAHGYQEQTGGVTVEADNADLSLSLTPLP